MSFNGCGRLRPPVAYPPAPPRPSAKRNPFRAIEPIYRMPPAPASAPLLTNCPNCGAPYEPLCSYCGTPRAPARHIPRIRQPEPTVK